MNSNDAITLLSSLLGGQIAWSPSRGHGSYLTIEFGKPHLTVRDPVANSKIESLKRRRAKVVGDCTLWVQDCYWKMTHNSTILSDSNSDHADISKTIDFISGSTLSEFRQCGNALEILFDNYKISIVCDDDPSSTALSFHFFSGYVFYLQDGCLKSEPGNPRKEIHPEMDLGRLG